MQKENTDFIYRNELDKACFQLDMAYGKSWQKRKEGLVSLMPFKK